MPNSATTDRFVYRWILIVIHVHMSHVLRKPAFYICENKDADQLRGTGKMISAFVFATRIVQSHYFLYTKFQASSHLLWLYSLVCVGPGRKPRRSVFSQRGSFIHIFPITHQDTAVTSQTLLRVGILLASD